MNHARANRNAPERFFRNIATANFSSDVKRKKLDVIRHHLTNANGGTSITDEKFHGFLKDYHLLGYDLGEEEGVVLSLINSHISQFETETPRLVWSRILEFTNNRNHHAGCITKRDLPEELTELFVIEPAKGIPEILTRPHVDSPDWGQHPDATYLALAVLLGSWNEKNKNDVEVVTQILGLPYEDWLKKVREILHLTGSPLSVNNGIWRITNRLELWDFLGSRILDQDLDRFKTNAVTVLRESDPAFELPIDERYTASIHGKVLNHSQVLRKGIVEGLAIVGSHPASFCNCSHGKAESIAVLATQEIFEDADWVVWGSLNNLLPTLAEAAPGEFLSAVEQSLRLTPCPFEELFSQEGSGITGGNYLTGLLWALESLAWEEQYLVRVCVVLGELASHDPGGQWANRPANSLSTILLPWLPQTLASVDKRKVAVLTLTKEWPDVAWDLIIRLLPGQHQTSTGSHKPSWRKTVPGDLEKRVRTQAYWLEVTYYAELAVNTAGGDISRLSELIDHFNHLPLPAFNQLLEVLASSEISEMPEEHRLPLWERLTKFTIRHRRFAEAKWALPREQVEKIEGVAGNLAPADTFNLHQHLFSNRDHDLHEDNGDWEVQRNRLDLRREAGVTEIFQQHGFEGVIRFADIVASPGQVGLALGAITDEEIEQALLPFFLNALDKHKDLVRGFVWKRHHVKGWEWADGLDKSDWTSVEIGQFLACLPFTKDTWSRVSGLLQNLDGEYWTRASTNACQADCDISSAIEKLIEHGRPHAAISCLYRMLHSKQPIETNQCVQALLAALSSNEASYAMDSYYIVELIKFLQADPAGNEDGLFKVEWAYHPMLNHHHGTAPQLLENRLANKPEFFCEAIRLIYRSTKEDKSRDEPSEELKAIATNVYRLLREWKTPPGKRKDGTFSQDHFTRWLQDVKELCTESGHLEEALRVIGEVLIHAPADQDGLWINRTVAAALNDRDAENMRRGFERETYNSRGVHWVDPSGRQERELADQFKGKAEEVENEGFQRLAATLRRLADCYADEAERVVVENRQEIDGA